MQAALPAYRDFGADRDEQQDESHQHYAKHAEEPAFQAGAVSGVLSTCVTIQYAAMKMMVCGRLTRMLLVRLRVWRCPKKYATTSSVYQTPGTQK